MLFCTRWCFEARVVSWWLFVVGRAEYEERGESSSV
jgi:hypothetical protein